MPASRHRLLKATSTPPFPHFGVAPTAPSVFQTRSWSMSAPAMPTMVSRLPKFGSWSKSTTQMSPSTTITRLPNGFYHHPGPAAVYSTSTGPSTSMRRTGSIRTPTDYSAKWRKDGVVPDGGGADNEEAESRGVNVKHGLNGTTHHSQQNSLLDSKKSTSLSPLKESNKSQTIPVSNNGLPVSKAKQAGSRLTNGTKQTLNCLSGSKLPSRTSNSLRPHQWSTRSGASTPALGPGSGSRLGSPLNAALPATRSLSTDNLGLAPLSRLAKNDRSRSRSLMAVQRRPSPTTTPTSASAPSLTTQGRSERGGGAKQGGRHSSCAPPPARVSSQAPGEGMKTTPYALKKPLLPGLGPAPKSNGISYKLSRPSLIKQPRPLRGTPTHGFLREPEVSRNGLGTSVETPSSTGSSAESTSEGPELEGLPSQGEMSILGETLEDMSLSSSSSLEQNHTSQEYMDDFDNLGNGGTGVVQLAKNDEDDSGLDRSCTAFCDHGVAVHGVIRETELNFVEHSLDWTSVTPGADEGQNQSREPEFHEQGGSSLDLSPSDSYCSGGIYMWDEEGLEALGGAIAHAAMDCSTTQHVGSFDSDVNGSDVLTNVDSCDLDDDDLMLDGDFPEDTSLRADEDGMSHMAEWRRRQLCWGTQEVQDDDDDSEPECYELSEDGGKDASGDVVLRPQRPAGLHVEELLEDFGTVKSQLEVLRRLLLQEDDTDDDTLTTDTLSPEDSDQSQVQALLQEVQQLKAELRSKNDIISQLTLQLQVVAPPTSRCRCKKMTERTEQHTQTSTAARESAASQTPWRERTAVPPVAFLSPPWQYQRSRPYGGRPKPGIPYHLATKRVETLVLYFSDTPRYRYFAPPARKTRTH